MCGLYAFNNSCSKNPAESYRKTSLLLILKPCIDKEIIKQPKKVKKGTGGCGEICKWAFTGNVVVRAEA